jgi:hypothetical protein
VLVTEDHASMPLNVEHHLAQGAHIPGVLVLLVRDIMEELALVAGALMSNDLRDRIVYLPLLDH